MKPINAGGFRYMGEMLLAQYNADRRPDVPVAAFGDHQRMPEEQRVGAPAVSLITG